MAEAVAPVLVVGVVAAPGASAELGRALREELRAELAGRHPEVTWELRVVEDALVPPPADDADIVAAARDRLLGGDWDLALVLTDLPLALDRRPVVAHASPLHGVAVLSVPALGAVGLRRRAVRTALDLLGTLAGNGSDPEERAGAGRRLRQLVTDPARDAAGVRFTARVLSGNLRLLVGMVRANRPWRLAARLSRALTAAVAAGVFALVTSDIWRLANAFGWLRLTAVALGSVVGIVVTLVVGAGLWEHTSGRRARKQVALFNLATVATLVLGVLALYATLFVLALAAGLLLVVPSLFAQGVGHPAQLSDYLELAWLTSSLATIGGALGAGLETDEAVREAAYTYHSGPVVPPGEG